MESKIDRIAQKIADANQLVIFTGAGMSTESGIPDYRSQGGIWDRFRPVYFDEFMSSKPDRVRYWQQRLDMEKSLRVSRPNKGHLAIASLFNMGRVHTVITQNIDGLHQASGIPDDKVIELHGNTRRVRCMTCSKRITWEEAEDMINEGALAPECDCGGFYKPDTISFGQAMPVRETEKAASVSSQSDVFIVIGSTLLVQPAALLPEYARKGGACLIIINLSETPYDRVCDIRITEKAGTVLEKIAFRVESILSKS